MSENPLFRQVMEITGTPLPQQRPLVEIAKSLEDKKKQKTTPSSLSWRTKVSRSAIESCQCQFATVEKKSWVGTLQVLVTPRVNSRR